MVRNYFEGRPPRPSASETAEVAEVRLAIEQAKARFDEEFNALNFSRALEAAWAGIARVDKFITESEPWKLAKATDARDRLESVIATAYEALRHIVILVAPVLPDSARRIWEQLGFEGSPLESNPAETPWGEPLGVETIGRISPAYPKLDKDKIMAEIEKEHAGSEKPATADEGATQPGATQAAATQAAAPPSPSYITIDDFAKVELRAATVLEAERVPKADKLLRLIIDVGEAEPRQILAGIAEYYAPEDIIGRKIVVVANLAPRKLRGLESNGMLLAASVGEEGRPVIATFPEDVPNGTRLK
jgi:methionyl-tRNA synthetase